MPTSEPGSLGELGAQAAARKYGLDLNTDPNGYHDAVYRSNGRKVQIKSASWERADGPGVVRVWKEHLEALEEHSGSVVVVVVSRDTDTVMKVAKVSPSALLEAGDFSRTRQASMRGMMEARLTWREALSL
jgi:hypothetical protein